MASPSTSRISLPGFDGRGLVIVQDQVADLGGNERCLQGLLERYPAAEALAPHFKPTNLPDGYTPDWVRRTRLIGRGGRRRSFLAPVYARRVASQRIDDAAVVLSITHGGWSAAARVPAGARHLCYSAGLAPNLWDHVRLYLRDQPPLARPAMAAAVPVLRAHFRRLMQRPDRLITNSSYSARRVDAVVGRGVEIVYPPVRTHFFTPTRAPASRTHFLMVARLIVQKRIDVVIEAFRGLDEQLVVAGDGTDRRRLERLAPANVRFTGSLDDERLLELYRSSKGFLCPSVESFGIAMVEALATGVPVIARGQGGALEIVTPGESGLLLRSVSARSIAEAVRALRERDFDAAACRAAAERFSQVRFTDRMDAIVREEAERATRPPAVRPVVAA
jgi:glycosyltransferase involved in cell wall biosynthesis